MSDNVIILGAGFSYDSGIPLLAGLVERMWELSVRKSYEGTALGNEDVQLFESAIKVKSELDSYHGRAMFDDRNIEDILSILTFNVMGGKRGDRDKLNLINRAVARTIEISCSVKHPGVLTREANRVITKGPELYRNFWRGLFAYVENGNEIPTIISFNYDLVLERALLQLLIGTAYDSGERRPPFQSFSVEYGHNRLPKIQYVVKQAQYHGRDFETMWGTTLGFSENQASGRHLTIEILKLHGSLNFPGQRTRFEESSYNFAEPLDDPQILPPIFNKMSSGSSDEMWRIALQRLRETKNVIVVGYSLPKTDIYMQYFLKAALGPNVDLNNIYVFDPALHKEGHQNKEMRVRYQECFAPQLHNRIRFDLTTSTKQENKGTASQFVQVLRSKPNKILF